MRIWLVSAAICMIGLFAATGYCAEPHSVNDFYLHDGDTVVFYGDSITAQQMYARNIENYVVLRFPKWHIKFINSGWSGDTATGGGGGKVDVRIDRDVVPYKPTVLTIFLGMNDGYYVAYDEPIAKLYIKSIAHIIDTVQKKLPGIRITLLTPSLFDYDALPDPPKSGIFPGYNQTLIKFAALIHKLGSERHIPVVELNRPLSEALAQGRAEDKKFALSKDGIHPDDMGHLIISSAVLQTWKAPKFNSEIMLLPGKTLVYKDPIQWPGPLESRNHFELSPLLRSFDLLHIRTKALESGTYHLMIDHKRIGAFTADQLNSGVLLTEKTAPMLYKAPRSAAEIVQNRIDKWAYLWQGSDLAVARYDDKPSAAEIGVLLSAQKWLDAWRTRAHTAAQPKTHIFLLEKTHELK